MLALAGTAEAQTSTNTFEVTQTGSGNIAEPDNRRAGNDNNRIVIVQNGRQNTASVLQIGDVNLSNVRQVGDTNLVVHTQEGDLHRSDTSQNGDANRSAIRQRDEFNGATVNQSGDRNYSQIAQGVEAAADRDFDGPGFFDPLSGSAIRPGEDNRVTVSQVGDDLASSIRQRARSGGPAADNNNAAVRQRGQGNLSNIIQESSANIARVFQFEGGNAAATRNSTVITQQNTSATSASNPPSDNIADIAVNGQGNVATVVQNGQANDARVTLGLGTTNMLQITQTGASNRVGIGQYGNSNAITIGQNSEVARADVWQQPGPTGNRSSNNNTEIQQGTGATGTAQFSAAFFNNSAPSGAQTRNMVANVVQGNGAGPVRWNLTQVGQDGVNLTANVQQAGTGTSALRNIVRIAQQGGSNGGNTATAIQGPGVGPSASTDTAPTGRPGDEFFFGGGARSAEITILQSGSNNTATIEQRGRGQFARIEQGPGSANIASILQEVDATNATAIIRQTGSNNSYSVVQNQANQYILVSQTGNGNVVTDVIQRP